MYALCGSVDPKEKSDINNKMRKHLSQYFMQYVFSIVVAVMYIFYFSHQCKRIADQNFKQTFVIRDHLSRNKIQTVNAILVLNILLIENIDVYIIRMQIVVIQGRYESANM